MSLHFARSPDTKKAFFARSLFYSLSFSYSPLAPTHNALFSHVVEWRHLLRSGFFHCAFLLSREIRINLRSVLQLGFKRHSIKKNRISAGWKFSKWPQLWVMLLETRKVQHPVTLTPCNELERWVAFCIDFFASITSLYWYYAYFWVLTGNLLMFL